MCLRYITCHRFLSTNKYITRSNEYFKGKTRCNNDIPYFARKSIHLLKCNFLFFIVYMPRPTFFWPYDFDIQAFSKQLFSFPQVAVKRDPTFCSHHQKPPLPTSTEVMFFHYFLCCVDSGVASPGCNPWADLPSLPEFPGVSRNGA